MRRLVQQFPAEHQGPAQVSLDPLWRSPFGANVYLYATLPFLLGIAGVVLLLSCANVANLMLVRSVARRRELAVRLAMGASRWRLVRQSLAESALLALGGAAVAVTATGWTAELFQWLVPPMTNPVALNGRLDVPVILATVGIAMASSLVSGILPAMRSTKVEPVEVLNEETGRVSGGIHRARLTRGLVVAQVALSLLLLVFAGLFVRSLDNAQRAHPGFDVDGVLLATFDLGAGGFTPETGIAFQRDVLARVKAQPGVREAALADWVPLTLSKRTRPVEVSGYTPRNDEEMDLRRAVVSPGYFETMRIGLKTGREFNLLDTLESEPVAMVDETFAARYWPGQDAVGQRIRTDGTWRTVVGVARATRHHRVNETADPMFYLPAFQSYRTELVLHARVQGDPSAFGPSARRAVNDLNPSLPVYDVMTLRSAIRIATVLERMGGMFVGAFGLVALLLAAVGIYGVLSYTTRQRTHELGVRMALGAGRSHVFGIVVADGARLTAAGLLAGLAASMGLTRVARGMLYGVAEIDLLTYAFVVAVLSVVALAACAIPAWRAARVEPLDALRTEWHHRGAGGPWAP
ncbi:MAG: FtsX-like permease family protein [Candidatus Rokuibacteriota bacterium]|nr:MAG: FtsX-like permease family protein [Candidatus Rokubacteria bacterium]